MLLTHVGQMLYSMQSRRQWTVWIDGIKYREFLFISILRRYFWSYN